MTFLRPLFIPLLVLLVFGLVLPLGAAAAPENVAFIKKVFPSQESWDTVFRIQAINPACRLGKRILSYENFLAAAAKYPNFCGNPTEKENVHELAAFLANASLETNGAMRGLYNGGLCFASEVGCRTGGCDYCRGMTPPWNKAPKCPDGYYGRGALQITNPYNYHEASQELYGDDRFLDDPSLVLQHNNAWLTSINFWMKHVGGLANSHTSLLGLTTCHKAIDAGDFGKTVEVINGNLECENPGQAFYTKTQGRIGYYKAYSALFGKRLGLSVAPLTHLRCFSGKPKPPAPTGYRCGRTWQEANTNCTKGCRNKGDCGQGEDCYAGLDRTVCK